MFLNLRGAEGLIKVSLADSEELAVKRARNGAQGAKICVIQFLKVIQSEYLFSVARRGHGYIPM